MSLPSPALLLRSCRPPLCSLKNVSRETFVRGVGPHRALGSALAEQGPRWVPEGALRNEPSSILAKHLGDDCARSRKRRRRFFPAAVRAAFPGRPLRLPSIQIEGRSDPREDRRSAALNGPAPIPKPPDLPRSGIPALHRSPPRLRHPSPLLRPIATERHPRKRRLRIARSPRRRTAAAPNGKRQQTRAARGRRHARARRIPPTTRTPHAPRKPARARRAPSARKPPSPAPSQTPRCKRSAPRGSCRCPACPRR